VATYRDGLAGHAPAVTDPLPGDRDSWLVQGWAVTDPAALAEMSNPEGETVVQISDRLVPFFRRED
jgi:hypothetical protein